MIREIKMTALYECDEERELVPSARVEEMVYEDIIENFVHDEGFQGLRVDCNDYYQMDEEEKCKLKRFVGCE